MTVRAPLAGRARVAAVTVAAWAALTVAAPTTSTLTTAQFRTGVSLVEVFATVTDARGRPVVGLAQTDFVVREDGVEQQVTAFAGGTLPLSVALAIDRSWSMAGTRLRVARSAAHAFLGELNPDDRAMLIAVSSELDTIAPLSTDREGQHRAVDTLEAWGTTRLHDAVIDAVDRISGASGRRALVVLSDGADRYSRTTADEVEAFVRRSDVLVYPVALGDVMPPIFEKLATMTGGRAYHVTATSQLSPAFREIASELRHQYLLGYVSSRAAPAQGDSWRTIDVTVSQPRARVRARAGYFAR